MMKITKSQLKQIIKEELLNYYYVLDVNKGQPTDDLKDIKKSYRKQAKQHHPDRGGDEKKMKSITDAGEVLLKDPDKKKNYDQQLYKDTIACKEQGRPGAAYCGINGIALSPDNLARFAEIAGIKKDEPAQTSGQSGSMDAFDALLKKKQAILGGIINRFNAAAARQDLKAMRNFLKLHQTVTTIDNIDDLSGYEQFIGK